MKVITNLCGKTKFSPAQILASRFVMLYVVNVHQMLLLSLLCYYSSLLSHSVLNLVEVGWRGLRVGSRFALFYIHSDDSCNNLCHDDSTINITNSITIIITLTYHTYLLTYLLTYLSFIILLQTSATVILTSVSHTVMHYSDV